MFVPELSYFLNGSYCIFYAHETFPTSQWHIHFVKFCLKFSYQYARNYLSLWPLQTKEISCVCCRYMALLACTILRLSLTKTISIMGVSSGYAEYDLAYMSTDNADIWRNIPFLPLTSFAVFSHISKHFRHICEYINIVTVKMHQHCNCYVQVE